MLVFVHSVEKLSAKHNPPVSKNDAGGLCLVNTVRSYLPEADSRITAVAMTLR